MALSLFELGSDPNPEDPPTPEVPDGEDVGTLDIARANLEDNFQRVKGSAEGLLRAGGQMMRQAISDPTGTLDTMRSTVDSITRAVAVPDAALSPVWSERGTTYHFGAFEFPFDGLKQEAEVRNNAEALVYQTEKFLADNADSVPEDAKSNVEEPLGELKAAIEAGDLAAMKAATDKVAQASQALGAAMYTMAQQEGQDGAAAAEGAAEDAADSAEEEVIDAEIVDEEEAK